MKPDERLGLTRSPSQWEGAALISAHRIEVVTVEPEAAVRARSTTTRAAPPPGSGVLLVPHFHDPGASGAVPHDPHRPYLAPQVRVVVDALLADFKTQREVQLFRTLRHAYWRVS